jgi:SET domain-containing protein
MMFTKVVLLISVILILASVWLFRPNRTEPEVVEEPFVSKPEIPYMQPQAEIKHSNHIGERGVFALRDYARGEVIEVCPALKQTHEMVDGEVSHYVFTLDDTFSLIGFGFCSMYNHSDQNNADWEAINEKQIEIVANQTIPKGQEIFISYGDEYWEGRKKK